MRTTLLWSLWIIGTLAIAGAVATRLYLGGDRTAFLPGDTAGVHHQIEMACETCHTSDDFSKFVLSNTHMNVHTYPT